MGRLKSNKVRLGASSAYYRFLAADTVLFVSYSTVIGFRREGKEYFTDENYSATTNKHAKAFGRNTKNTYDHETFRYYLDKFNLSERD